MISPGADAEILTVIRQPEGCPRRLRRSSDLMEGEDDRPGSRPTSRTMMSGTVPRGRPGRSDEREPVRA
jgi:hypothetical protein